MTSTLKSNLTFIGSLLLGVAALGGVLLGMGARVDDGKLEQPVATGAQAERQQLALDIAGIEKSAGIEAVGGSFGPAIAVEAKEWLDAVGGIWVPWPSGAPEGYTNPPAEPNVVGTAEDFLASLTSLSERALTELDNPALGTSISLASRIDAVELGGSCGTVDDVAVAVAMAAAPGAKDASGDDADKTPVAVLETVRQLLEQEAAEIEPGKRDVEIAQVARLDAIINDAIELGAADTRPAIVPIVDNPSEAALELVREAVVSIGAASDPAVRERLVAFACSLHDTEEERAMVGALPGIGD